MPINHLHLTLQRLLLQLRPGKRVTRIRNWSWLLLGLCPSRSVHLSKKIANKIPTKATLPSATRCLSRLLDNAAIRVRDWYEPIACSLLERAAQGGGEIRLIVDGSKIGFDHQLLMVSLAYRRRAIPIAWRAGLEAKRAIALLTTHIPHPVLSFWGFSFLGSTIGGFPAKQGLSVVSVLGLSRNGRMWEQRGNR